MSKPRGISQRGGGGLPRKWEKVLQSHNQRDPTPFNDAIRETVPGMKMQFRLTHPVLQCGRDVVVTAGGLREKGCLRTIARGGEDTGERGKAGIKFDNKV